MASPTIPSQWASSSANESTSSALTVAAGDLVVIQWAAATPSVTFTLTGGSGATFYRSSPSSTTTSLTSSGVGQTSAMNPNGDIDAYQSDSTGRVAFTTSVIVKTAGTITVSHAVASGARRFVVYVVRPPSGYYWKDGLWSLGGGRVVRGGYGTSGTSETTLAWITSPFDYRTQDGGIACNAQIRGTAASSTTDFGSGAVTHDATADGSVVAHTYKQLFDYNDGTWSSASLTYSAATTNKSTVAAMYGLTRSTVVVGACAATTVARTSGNAQIVKVVGTATATSPQAAAWNGFALLSTPRATSPAIAAAPIVVPVTGTARTISRAKAPAAPSLVVSPLTLLARETGVYNDWDVTDPVRARVNKTEDYDVFGADLGFSWDGGGGKVFVAFGDTFGSSWVGPFTDRQSPVTTTVAAGSSGADVTTLTELYVTSASTLPAPTGGSGSTAYTFRRVTVTTSTGYATFRYTGRDTTANKLTGLTLETGTGTLSGASSVTTGDPRGNFGYWRSQTLAYHTDTNLADGYVLDGFVVNSTGVAAGAAKELVPSAHDGDTTSARYTTATALTVTSISRVLGFAVSITTSTPHGLVRPGQFVYLTGLTGTLGSSFNGKDWRVGGITNSTTFYITSFGSNVTAYNPGGTVKVQPNPNPSNTTLNPEVTLVPTGGVAIPRAGSARGYRQIMALMSVNHWGDNGGNTINHTVLAYSDDDGQTWTKLSWRWDNDATFTSRNTGFWMWRHDDGYVYALAQGIYRVDPPIALRCAENDLLTESAWEYWNGTRWIAGDLSAAVPVWESGLSGAMAEPSLYYNPGNQCWVAVYLNELDWVNGTGIYLRSAAHIGGPWSTPQRIHDGSYWTPGQGVYGGFIHPWSAVAPQGPSDLYFHVSLADPYSTYLLKATLGPITIPATAARTVSTSVATITRVEVAPASTAQATSRTAASAQLVAVQTGTASTPARARSTIATIVPGTTLAPATTIATITGTFLATGRSLTIARTATTSSNTFLGSGAARTVGRTAATQIVAYAQATGTTRAAATGFTGPLASLGNGNWIIGTTARVLRLTQGTTVTTVSPTSVALPSPTTIALLEE